MLKWTVHIPQRESRKSYIILLDIHIKKNHMEAGDRHTKVKTDDCDMDCKRLAQNRMQ